jgi:hypothetical protein
LSVFIKVGNDWRVIDAPEDATRNTLPVGVFTVSFSQQMGYYLTHLDNFNLPSKTYGKEISRSTRVINTFLERPNSTGIVLAGAKGSGKTLLTKKIAIELAEEHQIPTLVVSSKYHGDDFNKFIQAIEQPAAVVFDEFEKVYDKEAQQLLLSLFDGVIPSKKLYIITVNDTWRMDEFLLNRPGRFYYMFKYAGLSEEAIDEFCRDKLKQIDELQAIKNYSKMFTDFTFDMLSAIVEEMNRHDESLDEVLKYLNISYNEAPGAVYETNFLEVAGHPKIAKFGEVNYSNKFNPISTKASLYYYTAKTAGSTKDYDENELVEEDGSLTHYLDLDPNNIVNIDEAGTVTYKTRDATVIIRRKQITMFDYKELTKI